MSEVLRGVRVVELVSWTYVPSAGAALTDWSADVIKVESIVDSSLLAQAMWSIAPSISVVNLFDIYGIHGAPPGLAINPLVNRHKIRDRSGRTATLSLTLTTNATSTRLSPPQCNSTRPPRCPPVRPNMDSTPRRFCWSSTSTATTSRRPRTTARFCRRRGQ